MPRNSTASSPPRALWATAFLGLFFDYYDLYLFIYLERTLAADFALSPQASAAVQAVGLAGVGAGALGFGYFADNYSRGRALLAALVTQAVGLVALSLAGNVGSLVAARLLVSLALGAEWGITHAWLAERLPPGRRYAWSAWLQLAILGGLLAWAAKTYVLPHTGWRALFAASLVPVVLLALARGRLLLGEGESPAASSLPTGRSRSLLAALRRQAVPFAFCLGLASLTIASGTVNIFLVKDLPQSPYYSAAFWLMLAPGMGLGAFIVRRAGVRRALLIYATALGVLSLAAYASDWSGRRLAFALALPVLNGIPFGLMGALFNEVFRDCRTALSGAAYNLGRIAAGFAPPLVEALRLHTGGNYFLFTAALAAGVAILGLGFRRWAPAAEEARTA